MSNKTITAIKPAVAEPCLIGLPFGLSAWEVTLPVGGINFLCGWDFRNADGESEFYLSANGRPMELTKEQAIFHVHQWDWARLSWMKYEPDAVEDCWEEPSDDLGDEPDFDDFDDIEERRAEWDRARGLW